jgi:hypothetical protein
VKVAASNISPAAFTVLNRFVAIRLASEARRMELANFSVPEIRAVNHPPLPG